MSESPAALEIRFPVERLNDGAGDPYWIDLTLEEARRLHDAQLAGRLGLTPAEGDQVFALA
ncbi:MAG: hypothetical protein VB131_05340 [Burkholderia gladioli]